MASTLNTQIKKVFKKGYKKLRDTIPVESGNYPYVTARIKAKKALLYPKEMYAKMLQMDIPAIARIIGEGEYKKEILRLSPRLSGVDLIEATTFENLARVFTQIIEFSEGHLKIMLQAYLDRWDVRNIKTILRGKFYKASAQEIMDNLVPAGSLPDYFLYELAGMETVEDIFNNLEDTLFSRTLTYIDKEPSELTNLAEYEDSLSHLYYEELLWTIEPSTFGSKLFLNFVREEMDMLNLKTLLRLWFQKATPEREVFLDGGMETKKEDLRAMLSLDYPAILNRLSEYSFYEDIAEDLKLLKEVGISRMFRRLERAHMARTTRYAHLYPLSIIPVLDFIVAKEREVQNLRIIARGKESNLPTDVIKDMLVM